MQVVEVLNEGLKHTFTVMVPKAQLRALAEERLQELSKTARINGFRPGKVPLAHLQKRHGRDVLLDVVRGQLEEGGKSVIAERGLTPAYEPDVRLHPGEEILEQVLLGNKDLSFTLTFEVTPTFDLQDLGDVVLSKPVVEVSDEDLQTSLKEISEQNPPMEEVEDPAQMKDTLEINFVGRLDGVPFEGGTAEGVSLELGSQKFIPGFEEQLVGVRAGETKVLKVTFPDLYSEKSLAGKEVEFEVTVLKISRPGAAIVDEALAVRLGFETLEALTEDVKKHLLSQAEGLVRLRMKRALLDILDTTYAFDLPEKLVDLEFSRVENAIAQEAQRTKESLPEGTAAQREEYRKVAARRVRLGLVFNAIVEKNTITVSAEELRGALMERARHFPGNPQMLVDYYRNNPEALADLRGPVLEEKVVDHLLTEVSLEEMPVTYKVLCDLIREDELRDKSEFLEEGDEVSAQEATPQT